MASRTPSDRKSTKESRPMDSPTTPAPLQPLEPIPPVEQPVSERKTKPVFDDLGDLTDLGIMESATVSALVQAAVGDPEENDDDDVLGLNKPRESTSGPPSGFMRPSFAPDDDALSLDMLPSAPGADAPLSFVARSDVRKYAAEADDIIATSASKPTGTSSAWYTKPNSGKMKPDENSSLSGRIGKSTDQPVERSDIFSGSAPPKGRSGDSNLLSFMAGKKGESSDILSGLPGAPSSDLFGDSRVLTELPTDGSRISSDILSGSRHSSDILVSSNTSSDILGDYSSARGSSLFDDPAKATDKLSDPNSNASITSPDQFVPLFGDTPDGSAISFNRQAAKGPKSSPDPIDDDPGRVSFDIPKRKKTTVEPEDQTSPLIDVDDEEGEKTGFHSVSDDDDAMAAEFLSSGEKSSVDFLGELEHHDTMSDAEDDESDLFSGPTIMDLDLEGNSGINLLDPVAGSKLITGRSPLDPKSELSIFSDPTSAEQMSSGSEPAGSPSQTNTNSNAPPSIFGPDTGGPSSAIFPASKKKNEGNTDNGHVSFDMPNRKKTDEQTDQMQPSGMIDWSKSPADSDHMLQKTQATDRLDLSDNLLQNAVESNDQLTEAIESDSVFDVHLPDDASTESQLLKAEAYAKAAAMGTAVAESGIIAGRSGKIPKVEPVSSRSKFVPPPPVKRSGIGWLGGTAAGLLVGVGISSAAYGLGFIPNKEPLAEIAALKQESDARISQATSAAAAASEQAKQEAEQARQKANDLDLELRRSKANELELRSKANAADRTARTANEEKNKALEKVNDAVADAASANAKVSEAVSAAEKAKAAREELVNKVAIAEMAVQKKADEVEKANLLVAAAESNVKATKSTLATIAKELQSAGLIDAKLNSELAVASIPDAIKKASTVVASTDGTKLKEIAEKLVTAQRDADTARIAARDAQTSADAALASSKKEQNELIAKYETELKTAKAGSTSEIEKSIAAAVKSYQSKLESKEAELKRTQDDLNKEVSRYETRLAAQAEEFRQQIIAARSGIMVATTDVERTAAERASRLFGLGADAYFDGRFGEAVASLEDATKANPTDARAWYYLGLSRWATGERNAAIEAFKSGGQWESRSATASKQVGSVLERVQGPARLALDAYRP